MSKPIDTKEALEKYKQMLEERGMTSEASNVEKHMEEIKLQEKIKQFYCQHTYIRIRTKIGLIPCNMKLCSKCGFSP
jgi:hypothetical protein